MIYVDVADRSRDSVNNSDIVSRIKRLGGVPLSEDREIDVRYVKSFPGGIISQLETDGNLIFAAGTTYNASTRERIPRIFASDPTRESWLDLSPENLAAVTCLEWSDETLWVGTTDGLWRGDDSGSNWKRFSTEDGLPDAAISAVNVSGEDVYVGVGNRSSGGLVRITADGSIAVMEGEGAPRAGPIDIINRDGFLIVSSAGVIQQQNLQTGVWEKLGYSSVARIFETASGAVASTYQKELFTLDELREAATEWRKKARTKKAREMAPQWEVLNLKAGMQTPGSREAWVTPATSSSSPLSGMTKSGLAELPGTDSRVLASTASTKKPANSRCSNRETVFGPAQRTQPSVPW